MKAMVGAPVTALSDTTTVGSITSMEILEETLPLDAWRLAQISSLVVNVGLLNNRSDSLVVSIGTDVCLLGSLACQVSTNRKGWALLPSSWYP